MNSAKVTLQEGVNTLSLSQYQGNGLSDVLIKNADGTPYYSETAPGSVQYGDSTHEYDAVWDVIQDDQRSSFYLESHIIKPSESAFVNAVIFGKTYQVRFA